MKLNFDIKTRGLAAIIPSFFFKIHWERGREFYLQGNFDFFCRIEVSGDREIIEQVLNVLFLQHDCNIVYRTSVQCTCNVKWLMYRYGLVLKFWIGPAWIMQQKHLLPAKNKPDCFCILQLKFKAYSDVVISRNEWKTEEIRSWNIFKANFPFKTNS